ncbi:hypothetical protein ACFW6V_24340 [Streptomyces sp. NPDC058734]|uniref:hypothetical protein n=1 Tax=Streptomyces sp. NPDC058734 TaxID=3346615 RepID=UPI0036C1956B
MNEPVFVIHGVANRDPDGFAASVAALRTATGLDMVPVHWGDLGADDRHVAAAFPGRTGSPVVPGPRLPEDGGLRSAPGDGWPQVESAVRTWLGKAADGADSGLRGAPAPAPTVPDGLFEYLAGEWTKTEWLRHSDDPALLVEAGRALAETLAEQGGPGAGAGHGQRGYGGYGGSGRYGGSGAYDGLRGRDGEDADGRLRARLRDRLQALDRVAGAAISAALGRVNTVMRTAAAPGTARFLGDVLVYQRHRDRVHARVRETVDRVDPALGRTRDRPVRVVAHSLGGVVAFDMATSAEPLWTSSLVTFGSQPAFFHAIDPRGGSLPPYEGADPVVLPPSLRRWTNLWEPMDVLAFVAARMFRLHDGSAPEDVCVPAPAGGLNWGWTHSAYWDLPLVATEIGRAMAAAPR